MGFMYRLVFASGKAYVGITTRTMPRRYAQHAYLAKSGSNLAVHAAWRKHGAPVVASLQQLNDDDLAAAEVAEIKRLGTLAPCGYNTTPGGEFSPALLPAVAEKIAAGRVGMVFTDKHRKALSEAHRGLPSAKKGVPMSEAQKKKLADAWVKRKQAGGMSEQTREKIAEARRGKTLSAEAKAKVSAARKLYWQAKRAALNVRLEEAGLPG